MSEAAKVYLVSSGEYSDYSVSCAFTTRELAIAYCASQNGCTTQEQVTVQEIDEMPYSEAKHLEAALPAHLRRLLGGYSMRVEERDLFDEVPVV